MTPRSCRRARREDSCVGPPISYWIGACPTPRWRTPFQCDNFALARYAESATTMTIDFKASRDVIIRTEKFAEAVQFYRPARQPRRRGGGGASCARWFRRGLLSFVCGTWTPTWAGVRLSRIGLSGRQAGAPRRRLHGRRGGPVRAALLYPRPARIGVQYRAAARGMIFMRQ